MDGNGLNQLDSQFVEFYEAARSAVVEAQKRKALIVVQDDMMQLYHRDLPVLEFPGLRPALYTKTKTIAHIPLAIFCLLRAHAGADRLPESVTAKAASYLVELKGLSDELDLRNEVERGQAAKRVEIPARAIAFLDQVLAQQKVSEADLNGFAGAQAPDIGVAMGGAVRAQLDACHERVMHIKHDVLSDQEWKDLRVLILGAYMARQGDIFLQYFSEILHTPQQGDRRLVYFESGDMGEAYDRLGTTMLDTEASSAFFSNENRLHRDMLADETTTYLKTLLTELETRPDQSAQ